MMDKQLLPMDTLLPLLARELKRRRLAAIGLFAIIALAALALGMLWPKTYRASTTILVQQNRIIAPLMEGAATPTATRSRAEIASAIILSNDAMQKVVAAGGWLKDDPDSEELARIIRHIKARTRIRYSKDNLLTISYRDSDPQRTYEVTRLFKSIFINESQASKQQESQQAFEFINSQVESYRKKLATADQNLKEYGQKNPDLKPNNEQSVAHRIAQLRTQIQQARIELAQKTSRQASLQKQLSSQSEVNVVQTKTGVYQTQLAHLHDKLNQLLLTYTDEYPDVVRTRHQIQDVRQRLAQAKNNQQQTRADGAAQVDAGASAALDPGITYNPLYKQLNSQLASVRSDIAALSRKIAVTQQMLQKALRHSRRIAQSKEVTAALTRDYDVNQKVYEDLLQRRERARVSMQLDATQQGLTFKVKDPPTMPVNPTGLRLAHFALLGLLLGVAVPVGLLFGVMRLDPRIRSAEQLEQLVGLPVLADVPFDAAPRQRRMQYLKTLIAVLLVLAVFVVYAGIYLAKLRGL